MCSAADETSQSGFLAHYNNNSLSCRSGGEGGYAPRAAPCKGRHLEGRKYGTLKDGRFWRIGVNIADSDISTPI